jgi:predicted AlkP superfamily phosphohydrolase/phosphomutase
MIVLGVDGMDPAFLEAHWDSLPNLNRLRKSGDFRRLATTVPPQSPVAWSSVITGMDPGGHGIFDFIHRNPSTRMPVSSMAEASGSDRTLTIGPYVLPLSRGSIKTTRAGKAFWQTLGDHGIGATVIRMPANFPPVDCEQESLAGMGTVDMKGTSGTFTFFTDDPNEKRGQVPGGLIMRIAVSGGRAVLKIQGPDNSLRRDHAVTSVDLVAHVDPSESVARFDIGSDQVILRQGEWSEWIRTQFPLITGLKGASGMFRIYLQQVHPQLRVYVSPVNIDPESPELPLTTPATYGKKLNDALGPFYTQGIPEETSAFRAGILNRAEFLVQSHRILADSMKMFRYELAKFNGGLLFYYFSSVDQNSHMLWGKFDDELLEIYKAVDVAIGEAVAKAGPDTTLMIISDHGFAKFDRATHINSWLMREGFLTLDDPTKVGDDEVFAHVDWSKTQAYALGLNGIYLNLGGRESGGIVSGFERQEVRKEIAKRLLQFRDEKTGEMVVDKVYFPETAFKGKNLRNSPDIFVGFRRGYRASWQTALGAVPKNLLDDNTQAWIGDHCMAADQVPGVLLSNRKIRATEPQLFDVTSTILKEFGLANTEGMIGQSVF